MYVEFGNVLKQTKALLSIQQLCFPECILKEIIVDVCKDLTTRMFNAAMFMIAKK